MLIVVCLCGDLKRRFRGPSEEEKHPEPSRDSAMPRLSRAGLENYLVNPSPHSNSVVSVSSAQSNPHNNTINNNTHQHYNQNQQHSTTPAVAANTHTTVHYVNHQYF